MYMVKDMPEKRQNKAGLGLLMVLMGWTAVFAQSPDASYLAGMAGLEKKNLPEANEKLTWAISRNNADDRLFLARGEVYLMMKDFERAKTDFEEANEILPGVADIWLARVYGQTGNAGKATEMLRQHLQSPFRLPEDSIRRDPSFDGIQDSPEWFSVWDKDWYTPDEKAMAEAAYYMRRSQPEKALSLVDVALQSSSSAAGLYNQRGRIYLSTGNYAAAIADFTSALNLGKRSGDNRLKETLYIDNSTSILTNRGLAFLGAGRYKDAIADFNKVLREEPASFTTYLKRAEASAGTEGWDEAINDMKFYLGYFPDDQKAVYHCGLYYYDSGDYMNSLRCFNSNLKEDQANPVYFKARGKAYLKTSTLQYAISDLSMSLDLNPEDGETWMYLGVAKLQAGLKEEACSDFRKAIQLGMTAALQYQVDNCR
jgi:tetratricopeptide (TPR) repeat protein